MAVGFPLKTTYANGDVYSASDVNDTNGTINLLTTSTLSMSAGKNGCINGGQDIWQRGTSIATGTSNLYTSDRWQAGRSGATALTVSRQATSDTTNLPSIQYCARVQRDSGNTQTDLVKFYQSWENVSSTPYVGKAVTFSFYARRGANFSATSNNLEAYLLSGTGTNENVFAGFTGQATVGGSATNALTTTWQRFTFTGTVSSSATQLGIRFYYAPTGTASTNDYFEVTGVQVELGSTATTFSRAGGTIQGELAACQRYYFRNTPGVAYGFQAAGYGLNTTQSRQNVFLPVSMRVNPTSVDYANLSLEGAISISSLGLDQLAPSFVSLTTTGSTGLSGNIPYRLLNFNNTAGYLAFNAEL
jgi:hypothetical protein